MPGASELFASKFAFVKFCTRMITNIIYCIITAFYIGNQYLLPPRSSVTHFPFWNIRSLSDNNLGHNKCIHIKTPYLTFITYQSAVSDL